jgi:hypothetical protein
MPYQHLVVISDIIGSNCVGRQHTIFLAIMEDQLELEALERAANRFGQYVSDTLVEHEQQVQEVRANIYGKLSKELRASIKAYLPRYEHQILDFLYP